MRFSWQQIAGLAIVLGAYVALRFGGHDVPAEVGLINLGVLFLRSPQDEALERGVG